MSCVFKTCDSSHIPENRAICPIGTSPHDGHQTHADFHQLAIAVFVGIHIDAFKSNIVPQQKFFGVEAAGTSWLPINLQRRRCVRCCCGHVSLPGNPSTIIDAVHLGPHSNCSSECAGAQACRGEDAKKIVAASLFTCRFGGKNRPIYECIAIRVCNFFSQVRLRRSKQ